MQFNVKTIAIALMSTLFVEVLATPMVALSEKREITPVVLRKRCIPADPNVDAEVARRALDARDPEVTVENYAIVVDVYSGC